MSYLIPSPVRRVRLFFGLSLALLVVILFASMWTTARLRDAARSAARGYSAFEAATQAHRQVVLSYQAVRSYLSDGDPSYLADRRAADERSGPASPSSGDCSGTTRRGNVVTTRSRPPCGARPS